MVKYFLKITLLSFFFFSCSSNIIEKLDLEETPTANNSFISAVDISYFPKIEAYNLSFKDRNNSSKDFLNILKENGINTIRLRLWHTPSDVNSGFSVVKTFSQRIKAMGFKVWLTVHYSDDWADPAKQVTPAAWSSLSFNRLKESVYNYTSKIMSEIHPDIIQIGNEIDNGFLHPYGHIDNQSDFLQLLSQGISAVRNHNTTTKIMIHKANPSSADWFFTIVDHLDYDYIGLSYYPKWHGKDLTVLKNLLSSVSNKFDKEFILAETSYPFTHAWNDYTNNVIGDNSQIIYPDYPATINGQYDYLKEIKTIVKSVNGIGFAYWGAEWVAFDGQTSSNGSSWENQALFDFNLKATKAIEVFNED